MASSLPLRRGAAASEAGSGIDVDGDRGHRKILGRLTTAQRGWARRRETEALRREVEALRRESRELRGFASSIAHDLREPLAALSLSADLLAAGHGDDLDAAARELLDYVTAGAAHMATLIDGTLAAARGDRRSGPRRVDCARIADEVVTALSPLLHEAGARVVVEPLPPVLADEVAVRRVLQNLICNAVKFTLPGTPSQVVVSAEPAPGEWRISVTDQGIGLPERGRERLFEPLLRAPDAAAYPGSGIGLAICRTALERCGGRIWATSTPEGGSRFTFALPAAPDRDRPAVAVVLETACGDQPAAAAPPDADRPPIAAGASVLAPGVSSTTPRWT